MKQIMTIAAALLISSPAFAATSPSAAEWDCGNGVKVFSSKGEMGLYFSYGPGPQDPDVGNPRRYKVRGIRHFDLKWDYRPKDGSKETKILLNGKACEQSN